MDRRFLLSLLLMSALSVSAAPAPMKRFAGKRVLRFGSEHGVVTVHGHDVFEIASAAGGFTPATRAEIVAERLNEMERTRGLHPEDFSVGRMNNEVIVQENAADAARLVVTVDRVLAQHTPGARGSVQRLAHWWLAILRDHICLATGKSPLYTTGTSVGAVFQKVYKQLDITSDVVSEEQVVEATKALPMEERELLMGAAYRVAEEFDPRRLIVVYVPPKKRAPAPAVGREIPFRPSIVPSVSQTAQPSPSGGAKMGEETKPAPSPTAAPEPPNVRTKGRFRVELLNGKENPRAGQSTLLKLKISDTAEKDALRGEPLPVVGATVVAWTKLEQESAVMSEPISARAEEEAGVYALNVTFATGGVYRLTVGVFPIEGGGFKVEFKVVVAPKPSVPEPRLPGESKGETRSPSEQPVVTVRPAEKKEASPSEEKAPITVLPSPQKSDDAHAGHEPPNAQPPAPGIPPSARKPTSPRDKVGVVITREGNLEARWLEGGPVPKSVTFVLLDGAGEVIDSRTVTSAPFTMQWKEAPDALRKIRVVTQYRSGVQTEVAIPFQPPPRS